MDERDTLHIAFTLTKADEYPEPIAYRASYYAFLADLKKISAHFEALIAPFSRDDEPGFVDTPILDPNLPSLANEFARGTDLEGLSRGEVGHTDVISRAQPRSATGRDITVIAHSWGSSVRHDGLKVSLRLPFLNPAPDLPFLQTLLTRIHDWRPVQHMVAGGRSALFSSRVFEDKQTVGWASWWPRPIPPEALRRAHLVTPMLGGTFVASTPEPFDYTQEPQVRAMQDLDVDLNEAGVLRPLTEIPLIP